MIDIYPQSLTCVSYSLHGGSLSLQRSIEQLVHVHVLVERSQNQIWPSDACTSLIIHNI
jgi:hypothetical protein